MLSNPNAGWCEIVVSGYRFPSASYLNDYPDEVPAAFEDWLDTGHGSFRVDCEGDGWFTVTLDDGELVIWEFDGDEGDGDRIVYRKRMTDRATKRMISELVGDLERDFDMWVEWMVPDCSAERVERRWLIEEHLENLKKRLSPLMP